MFHAIRTSIRYLFILIAVLGFGAGVQSAFAQTPSSGIYFPLIGITSVPDPLALPDGEGMVTYNYAVKNFLAEAPLTDIQVVDDTCAPVTFVEGDDNGDSNLDSSETWRYRCVTRLSTTTHSTATVKGTANNIAATHKAYATVVVGSNDPPPLVSIINITKVSYPLSLPADGGEITFTYKVNNPGLVPLSDVTVTDDKCRAMSGRLGDTNGNNLLDINEVWIYTCTTSLTKTTTNTVQVTAFANGLKAVGDATITVTVDIPAAEPAPGFPEVGGSLNGNGTVWAILFGLLLALLIIFVLTRKRKRGKGRKKTGALFQVIIVAVLVLGAVGVGLYFFLSSQRDQETPASTVSDASFGWKYPVTKFPLTGTEQLAYSDIRDPGGIPQGLPVRLKIPVIGVNSAIEDALITPDGRMDVPAGSVNVAWFALGPHPGNIGSAVIGGHFGIRDGVPFVFYRLDKVRVGDKIYIEDDRGATLAFMVRSIKLFDRNADATTVFTSDDGLAHLNLITCEGIWNRVNDSYPERRVVFADAIPSEGAAPASVAQPIPPTPAPLAPRSLGIGARGADVTELQTILVEKGFLVIPRGIAKGYFGSLTRAAVAKYQTSIGLRASGVFDATTRMQLMAAESPGPVKPILPSTAITTTESVTAPIPAKKPEPFIHLFIQSVKSLYATPLDGLITSALLIAIVFLVSKIVKR